MVYCTSFHPILSSFRDVFAVLDTKVPSANGGGRLAAYSSEKNPHGVSWLYSCSSFHIVIMSHKGAVATERDHRLPCTGTTGKDPFHRLLQRKHLLLPTANNQ